MEGAGDGGGRVLSRGNSVPGGWTPGNFLAGGRWDTLSMRQCRKGIEECGGRKNFMLAQGEAPALEGGSLARVFPLSMTGYVVDMGRVRGAGKGSRGVGGDQDPHMYVPNA